MRCKMCDLPLDEHSKDELEICKLHLDLHLPEG